MKKFFFGTSLITFFSSSFGQTKDEKAIHTLLSNQETFWNAGNID